MLEDIARDSAAHNCRYEVACSVKSVAESAAIQTVSATSSSLFSMVGKAKTGETEVIYLLDRFSLETVSTVTWAEVKRFFESTCDDDRGFNMHCAEEAARELNEGNLHMKNVTAAAQQLLSVPSWTAR